LIIKFKQLSVIKDIVAQYTTIVNNQKILI